MANILDIRRRIRSVTNTRQITRAMKMVSAARLRRAQDRALAARPYAQMLTNVLKSLVSRADIYDPATGELLHPLLVRRPEQNILLIVVTGDKGLAGAFNSNILKSASRFLESKAGKNIEILTVGRKGRDFMRRRFKAAEPTKAPTPAGSTSAPETTLVGEYVSVLNKVDYALASEISEQIIERYTNAEIDSVYLVYNEFKSVIAQRLIVEQVLPVGHIGAPDISQATEMELNDKRRAIEAAKGTGVSLRPADTSKADEEAAHFGTAQVDYIYEQPPRELFRALLPKYVGIQIFHALLESVAAEHAARMTAMESATNNAGEMIDSLTLSMNRVRQAKITREIIEIVSGAAAL
ncbi:MAG TPA: ATP synthase F1 subunit gamma [Terriglobales bacterium]|nr:ATP synthase F1 subunit gamma [Terriglobales bacterium]